MIVNPSIPTCSTPASGAASRAASRTVPVLVGLSVVLAGVMVLAVCVGPVRIAPLEVMAIVLGKLGIVVPVPVEATQQYVLVSVRVPRVLFGALVGAALAVSGAALQGVFRNPLADPGLIGVSSGAALAAAFALGLPVSSLAGIHLSDSSMIGNIFSGLRHLIVPGAAFVGGLIAVSLVYALSRVQGRVVLTRMLLVGIAVNALCAAGVGLMLAQSTDTHLRAITFWRLGSLGGATWQTVGLVAPLILLACLTLPRLARGLNLLALGESEARHLGLEVDRLRRLTLVCCALSVGAAVAFAGLIGFVGLVVPHVMRLLVGPDHRRLMPASVLGGAALLVASDTLARTLAAPAEWPIGVLTAFLGVPFFLWLVLRSRVSP